MKYSLRKSFRNRRRKEIHDDDPIYPRIDAHGCSNSNLNLVKPVKSKSFLQRRRHNSSSPPPSALPTDKLKSKVFEPRYDIHLNDDDDDEPFSSSINTRVRPFDRLTYQIRQSFRNTLTRQRSRLESTNSNKRLILNKNNENQTQIPMLYPILSTGLTSPLTISIENDPIKAPVKRRKAPLAPTRMNQSKSLPIGINPEQQLNNKNKQNLNQSFRKRFSLLLKKRPENHSNEDINDENFNKKSTLSQRFNSLRRSFHIGNRNSSNKNKGSLLFNE